MANANPTLFDSVQQEVEYRDIPGFPGYRVGSDGSVWSCLKRVGGKGSGRGAKAIITDQWHRLSENLNRDGCPRVNLRVSDGFGGGRMRPFHICRLVLLAFVGPCPNGMQACHEDGNPANNDPSNLRWDTAKANAADRRRHGRDMRGTKNANVRLTESAVRDIRANCIPGSPDLGFHVFARRYRVTTGAVIFAYKRVNWAWVD